MGGNIREIRLNDMVPFRGHSGQTYEGGRLQQLADSIKQHGLLCPVIVRSTDNGKYEIICGHNRTKAMRLLGRDSIPADIRDGLSDAEALELFYDSNLNQQSFSDWNYSQKIEAVKYSENLIKEHSKQGKRTDLERKKAAGTDNGTSVQTGQKLNEKPAGTTTRDRMARRLGISTATFSKYRRIIRLPDNLRQSVARLLDEKRITFEAAYIISSLGHKDIESLTEGMESQPDAKINMDRLKEFSARKKPDPSHLIVRAISDSKAPGILGILELPEKPILVKAIK